MKLMRIIYVRHTAPFHYRNATSPRQYQLASMCHLPQAIHQIYFFCSTGTATAHPDPWHAQHPLTRHLQHLLHLFLAQSTRLPYHTGIKHFIHFCKTQHVQPLPVTSHTATYFATALHKQGMATATICLYLSAVSTCHWENGFADPCKDIHCSHW